MLGFPSGSVSEESVCKAVDKGLIHGSERCPGEGNGNILQYSCLENPMDRGAWSLQSLGSQRIGHDRVANSNTIMRTYLHINIYVHICMLGAQSCPTLCDPMDCSLPGSSVHGILQAKILEWFASSFSRGSMPPRDRNWVCIAGKFFNV